MSKAKKKVTIYRDEAGEWRWHLTSSSDVVADSSEGYHRLGDCIAGIESTMGGRIKADENKIERDGEIIATVVIKP